ncbi:hypothetical protein ACFL0X_00440 [Nanoarchaeota archaeon]
MVKNQKWTFLYALIITILVFNFGIFMGYMLESNRIDEIKDWSFEAEMQILDQRIQRDAFDVVGLDCEIMIQENINFADRIFEEAQKISRYEDANRIGSEIRSQHKKYDLLRTLFWVNSIRIKQQCNSDYHNLVYFYKYNDPDLSQKAEQRFFSKLLGDVKERYGSNVMLIPIAGDNDLLSIELLMNKYNIDELPTILIDEDIKLTEVESFEDIEKYIN